MKSKKKQAYRCKCGFPAKNKKELIQHCNEDHQDEPCLLYDMIGEIGSIELGIKVISSLRQQKIILENKNRQLEQENALLTKEKNKLHKIYLAYNMAFTATANTNNLLNETLAEITRE